MPQKKLTRRQAEEAVDCVNKHATVGEKFPAAVAAKELNLNPRTLTNRLIRAKEYFDLDSLYGVPGDIKASIPETSPELELPEQEQDYERLCELRAKKFDHARAYEDVRKLIPVKLPYKGSCIGILAFGDLHLDDDGCDLALARAHAKLVREFGDGGPANGCYAISIGDHLNNWQGALAKKYASQSTTLAEGHVLVQGFLQELSGHWLCILGGNHDEWGTLKYFLDKIARDCGTRYIDSAAGLELKFPGGNTVRLRLAHQLPGSSIYAMAHSQTRDNIFRYRWEVVMSGHVHKSGYAVLKQEDTQIISHCIQIASYEIYSEYARGKQMKDAHISPCAFLVINSNLPNTHPDMIKLFWDPVEGADWLAFLQKKYDG